MILLVHHGKQAIFTRYNELSSMRTLRGTARNHIKECSLCGKIEDRNWQRHCSTKHKGQKVEPVKQGEYARSYYFSLSKKSVPEEWCTNFYDDLKPYLVLEHKKALVKFVKSQLLAGKLVPYEFTHYGAVAAREMFEEQKSIPKKLVPPTDDDYEKYNELYMSEYEEQESK